MTDLYLSPNSIDRLNRVQWSPIPGGIAAVWPHSREELEALADTAVGVSPLILFIRGVLSVGFLQADLWNLRNYGLSLPSSPRSWLMETTQRQVRGDTTPHVFVAPRRIKFSLTA